MRVLVTEETIDAIDVAVVRRIAVRDVQRCEVETDRRRVVRECVVRASIPETVRQLASSTPAR